MVATSTVAVAPVAGLGHRAPRPERDGQRGEVGPPAGVPAGTVNVSAGSVVAADLEHDLALAPRRRARHHLGDLQGGGRRRVRVRHLTTDSVSAAIVTVCGPGGVTTTSTTPATAPVPVSVTVHSEPATIGATVCSLAVRAGRHHEGAVRAVGARHRQLHVAAQGGAGPVDHLADAERPGPGRVVVDQRDLDVRVRRDPHRLLTDHDHVDGAVLARDGLGHRAIGRRRDRREDQRWHRIDAGGNRLGLVEGAAREAGNLRALDPDLDVPPQLVSPCSTLLIVSDPGGGSNVTCAPRTCSRSEPSA